MAVIGIIHKYEYPGRYGYYTVNKSYISEMEDDELFEPVFVIRNMLGTPEIYGGQVWETQTLVSLDNRVISLETNKLDTPYSLGGSIDVLFRTGSEGSPITYELDPEDNTMMLVTVEQMAFSYIWGTRENNTPGFLYPATQTLQVPLNSNYIVIGVIHGLSKHTHRYGFYSVNNGHCTPVNSGEVFEPICVYGQLISTSSTPAIISGILSDWLEIQRAKSAEQSLSREINKIRFGSAILNDDNFNVNSISVSKDNGVVTISIPKLIYSFKTNSTGAWFLYPDAATFEIPADGNMAVIGIIHKGQYPGRYGYYTVNKLYISEMAEDEFFEPLFSVINMLGTTPYVGGGPVWEVQQLLSLNSRTTALEAVVANVKQVNFSRVVLHEDNFVNLDMLGTVSGSTATVPSESLSIDNDGYLLVNQGITVWPRVHSRVHKQTTRISFNTSTAGGFNVGSYGLEDGGIGTLMENILSIDFSQNKITSPKTSEQVTYNFTQNHNYVLEAKRNDKHVECYMLDAISGVKTKILEFNGGTSDNFGLLYDVLAITNSNATSPKFSRYSIQSDVAEPNLIIFGDSITVGFTSTVVDGLFTGSYANRIGELTNKPYLASGRGGGSMTGLLGSTVKGFSYVGRIDLEVSALRPKYVMVTIGTNGGASYNDFKTLVEKIIGYGSYPIINKIPLRLDNNGNIPSYIPATNATIEQIWKDYKIHGCRFDIATSLNFDGVTFDPNKFISDNIHPNDLGHRLMAERVPIDCPELLV